MKGLSIKSVFGAAVSVPGMALVKWSKMRGIDKSSHAEPD